jgi:hypothetical protein
MNRDEMQGLWKGGYWEGDPLDPHSSSSYPGETATMSILHATYLRCIRPYVKVGHTALEIGPGRGAWTNCLLDFTKVWAVDVLPISETEFPFAHFSHVKYTTDTSLRIIPDYDIDYVFSFGCFCHCPQVVIQKYAQDMFPKLQHNANCFWMVADKEKYIATTGMSFPDKGQGHWYDGHDTAKMLVEEGYTILDEDVGTCLRDRIIWFQKGLQ